MHAFNPSRAARSWSRAAACLVAAATISVALPADPASAIVIIGNETEREDWASDPASHEAVGTVEVFNPSDTNAVIGRFNATVVRGGRAAIVPAHAVGFLSASNLRMIARGGETSDVSAIYLPQSWAWDPAAGNDWAMIEFETPLFSDPAAEAGSGWISVRPETAAETGADLGEWVRIVGSGPFSGGVTGTDPDDLVDRGDFHGVENFSQETPFTFDPPSGADDFGSERTLWHDFDVQAGSLTTTPGGGSTDFRAAWSSENGGLVYPATALDGNGEARAPDDEGTGGPGDAGAVAIAGDAITGMVSYNVGVYDGVSDGSITDFTVMTRGASWFSWTEIVHLLQELPSAGDPNSDLALGDVSALITQEELQTRLESLQDEIADDPDILPSTKAILADTVLPDGVLVLTGQDRVFDEETAFNLSQDAGLDLAIALTEFFPGFPSPNAAIPDFGLFVGYELFGGIEANDPTNIPEPSTAAVVGAMACLLAVRRRRRS